MHEKGAPVLYGPRISLILLSSPSTSVTTPSLVSPVLMAVVFLFEDVGSFGIDMCEADGIAFCFEKASIGFVCEIGVVFGMGIEIWI